jgi:hypothetical protein
MRKPRACLGVLAALLGLWPVVSHAITLPVTDDSYAQRDAPNVTSTAVATLFVDNRNPNKEHITYALFDLSLLPPNAPVHQAVLRVFVDKVFNPGTLQVQVVTGGAWTEQTLTWNTAPASVAAVPAVMASIFAADHKAYVTLDVTEIVQAWVNGTQTNLGLALRGASPALKMSLDSKENTGTSHPMELEVVLEGGAGGTPGPQGPQGPQGPIGPQGPMGHKGRRVSRASRDQQGRRARPGRKGRRDPWGRASPSFRGAGRLGSPTTGMKRSHLRARPG